MSLTTPTLRTDRLLLRPFEERDREDIYALQSDARVLEFWDSPPWTDRSRADTFLRTCRTMAETDRGVRVAVDRADDGSFIGWSTVLWSNPEFRTGELGYVLTEASWGRGYATEAAGALLDWALVAMDLNRVQSEVDTRNPASARVLQKLGFSLEGTLRENCIVDGVVSDSWMYALLRRERESVPSRAIDRRALT
jgi:RimJ/RimL family protein N-acetyltransferase